MEELIPIVAIFFVIGVPVMSIAARFVLRPLLRDFAKTLGRDQPDADIMSQLTERLGRLEGHLVEQDRRLDQLVDAELFRRQLEDKGRQSQLQASSEPDAPDWTGPEH